MSDCGKDDETFEATKPPETKEANVKTAQDRPGLMEWLKNDEGIFWISGKPGAGKSTLMIFIHNHENITHLYKTQQNGSADVISFFFHDLGIPSEKTFSGLLHALLYQILKLHLKLMSVIELRFQRLRRQSLPNLENESLWSDTELQAVLLDLQYSDKTGKILCIIDGLDECDEDSIPEMLQF